MNTALLQNLKNDHGNYILPFFWQHGEEEAVLREYMGVIYDCGIRSVCVESRPHPDFAGPKWWADMDVILDEARTRGMKVWILDDSHFPTGYANGALENGDPELCRQSIVCETIPAESGAETAIPVETHLHPQFKPEGMEAYMMDPSKLRTFEDDCMLSITARSESGAVVPLEAFVSDGILRWQVPAGNWQISFCVLTRNLGPHRNYINMLSKRACRVQIDAVYEPHYAHYKADFGKTIAGFFSDEPELGNGHLYDMNNYLGTPVDLPWSDEVETALREKLGAGWAAKMPLLWDHAALGADSAEIARIRHAYMDTVTRLVEKDFSFQLGDWCRAHGVEYIGHLIEDNNQHARTGSSLGHFFRGLGGQDMAGIDDIGGQVLPQGEDMELKSGFGAGRDGEFYHYVLAKLGASLAAIDPLKKGRTMCEIFGAYGWGEGVRLEKYLADHFLVRGVNRYVPHAFSAKDYPDPDCPPHFYAHGHNAEYRHFGALMRYMNRVCGLIDGGTHIAPAAILYHGEAEWTGKRMLMQKPARVLCDRQIDYDFIPQDVFSEPERYRTVLGSSLQIHTQTYRVLIVPYMQYVSAEFVKAADTLQKAGFPMVFIDGLPEGVYNGEADLDLLKDCTVTTLEKLPEVLAALRAAEISITPANDRIRALHYQKDGSDTYLFVNEGTETCKGEITIPTRGACCVYNAWDNRLESIPAEDTENGTVLSVCIEPLKSCIVVFGNTEGLPVYEPLHTADCAAHALTEWKRSTCCSKAYPAFGPAKTVTLPDDTAAEDPAFSGFVRYETAFVGKAGQKTVLEISDAYEGVEVFLNGESAGIQIAPPFRYDLTTKVHNGKNTLVIETATTPEREMFAKTGPSIFAPAEPTAPAGICGTVTLWTKE